MLKGLIRAITPPIIYGLLAKLYYRFAHAYHPRWYQIEGGILEGRSIFLDARTDSWQRQMVQGTYDRELFEYAKDLDLSGKAIFEVGAHFGFHAMCFAELVGPDGRVYAFEPNNFNRDRMRTILSRNPDLDARIALHDLAVSDKSGTARFYFSQDVETGVSSGSKLGDVYPKLGDEAFRDSGFIPQTVRTITLDELSLLGIKDIPALVKLDVEGAECLVLSGAQRMLREHRPILLIEIHSILNMLRAGLLLTRCDYSMELIKEEPDGRCIIAARSTLTVP
jgi:FkbM family methyltransferase